MKDKVLKLCKRLRNCTLEDILGLIDIEPEVLELMLLYFISEGNLKEENGVYTFIEQVKKERTPDDKNLNVMYMFHSPETVDLIIRGFCASIPSLKMSCLIGIGDNCICDFYRIFRNLIYERQLNELLNYYFKDPQQSRLRNFFNKTAYFYIYNNKIFVIKKPLQAKREKNFTDDEIQEFKKVYCYVSRIETHNKNEACMHQRIAESIWRREKSFDELYSDLKNNLIA